MIKVCTVANYPTAGEIEHWVLGHVKEVIPDSIQERWHAYRQNLKEAEIEKFGNDEISEHVEMVGWGVEEADRRNKGPEASKPPKKLNPHLPIFFPMPSSYLSPASSADLKSPPGLGTQLALAYAIHKSFIFLRVPLTAAVTPKVVKVLRGWGWNIGKRRSK